MKTILFICQHNSGRSQMGEAFVRAMSRRDIKAMSAGIDPAPEILPRVKEVMGEISISMRGQYPKVLTEDMLREADVIVATCDEVCVAIPDEIARTKRVEQWHLPVPTHSLKQLRELRDEIRKRVENLMEEL